MIVDDDALARKSMEKLCEKTTHLEVISVCASAAEAINKINENQIDLILLDIEMPDKTGLELLDELSYQPQIVFVTSNRDYAFEAFEYQVTDFVKKPVKVKRFMAAVDKAIKVQEGIEAYKKRSGDLYIRSEGRYIRLNINDIFFFENVGDYVRVKTETDAYIIHSTLKNIDRNLRDPRFLRIHRTYIINLDKIKDIKENTLVIDKDVIPISRANKSILMSRLNFL